MSDKLDFIIEDLRRNIESRLRECNTGQIEINLQVFKGSITSVNVNNHVKIPLYKQKKS